MQVLLKLSFSDETAKPKYLAIHLLSQAEHDEMASSIMITTCENIANETSIEVENYLKTLSREKIATNFYPSKRCDHRGIFNWKKCLNL